MLVAAALSVAVPGSATPRAPASGTPPSVRDLCRLVLTDTAAQLCFVAGFVLMIVYSQISSTLSVYVGQSVENGVGFFAMLLALNGALIVAVQLPMTALSERAGLAGSIVLGTALFAAGMALPPILGAEAWTFVAMMVLVTLGEALLFPISNSVFADLAAENTRSTYMGLFNATMLGLAAGPVLGSALAGWLGFDGLALAMAASILCCGGLYWIATQNRRGLSRTAS
jgi:MFS family permease